MKVVYATQDQWTDLKVKSSYSQPKVESKEASRN